MIFPYICTGSFLPFHSVYQFYFNCDFWILFGFIMYSLDRCKLSSMDHITIKTPNPKCRLYRWLIEFIDRRYSQSCLYFRPALWSTAPWLALPSPFPVCKGGGEYGVIVEEEASDRQTPAVKYLYWSIFKKVRPLGFGVLIYMWSKISSHLQFPATKNFESLHSARFHEVQN